MRKARKPTPPAVPDAPPIQGLNDMLDLVQIMARDVVPTLRRRAYKDPQGLGNEAYFIQGLAAEATTTIKIDRPDVGRGIREKLVPAPYYRIVLEHWQEPGRYRKKPGKTWKYDPATRTEKADRDTAMKILAALEDNFTRVQGHLDLLKKRQKLVDAADEVKKDYPEATICIDRVRMGFGEPLLRLNLEFCGEDLGALWELVPFAFRLGVLGSHSSRTYLDKAKLKAKSEENTWKRPSTKVTMSRLRRPAPMKGDAAKLAEHLKSEIRKGFKRDGIEYPDPPEASPPSRRPTSSRRAASSAATTTSGRKSGKGTSGRST